jgi:antitoxin component of MazEF toxin-antitoxin module
MSEIIQRAKKIGGSLMVRIPKDVADREGIHAGEDVRLTLTKARKDWFGAFPGLKPFDKEKDRFDFDDE